MSKSWSLYAKGEKFRLTPKGDNRDCHRKPSTRDLILELSDGRESSLDHQIEATV